MILKLLNDFMHFIQVRGLILRLYPDGGYEGLSVNESAGVLALKSASRVRNHDLEEMNEVNINPPILLVQIIAYVTEYPTIHIFTHSVNHSM